MVYKYWECGNNSFVLFSVHSSGSTRCLSYCHLHFHLHHTEFSLFSLCISHEKHEITTITAPEMRYPICECLFEAFSAHETAQTVKWDQIRHGMSTEKSAKSLVTITYIHSSYWQACFLMTEVSCLIANWERNWTMCPTVQDVRAKSTASNWQDKTRRRRVCTPNPHRHRPVCPSCWSLFCWFYNYLCLRHVNDFPWNRIDAVCACFCLSLLPFRLLDYLHTWLPSNVS